MTFEEALPVVQDIMAHTSVDEQARLLRFFGSPKAEQIEAQDLQRESTGGRGPVQKVESTKTMAVAAGKL